jgi:DNA-binding cell septation regulator SpoVG
MEVKVTKMFKRDGQSALKAFADVEITEGPLQVMVYGVKVFNTSAKGDFIGLPATPPKEPTGPNGKPAKWFDIVGFNKDTFFKVSDAVLNAYKTGQIDAPAKAAKPASTEGFGGSLGSGADDGDIPPF